MPIVPTKQSTRRRSGSTPTTRARSSRGAAIASRWIGAVALLACSGCGIGYAFGTGQAKPLVTQHAETDLDCPASELRVEEGWGGRWEAYGCGRHAVYNAKCNGVKCDVQSGDAAVPWADRPTNESGRSR